MRADKVSLLRYLEAARLKIGAHRSPRAGSPPDRSLRRWVSRAPLAPNSRSRSMCSEAQHGDWVLGIGDWVFEAARLHRHPNPQHLIPNPASAGPFEFLCSPRNCGVCSREFLPHHTQTTSLELNAVVDLSLPTRDEAIINVFRNGRIGLRNSTYFRVTWSARLPARSCFQTKRAGLKARAPASDSAELSGTNPSKMMRAKGEKQDDRQRHAKQKQNEGTHNNAP